MIEINLLPEELRKKPSLSSLLSGLPIRKAAIVSVSLFLGLQVLAIALVSITRLEEVSIQKEVASLKRENKDILARKAELAELKKQVQQMQTLTQRKFSWTVLLDSLTQSMIKGIWLRQLSLTEDKKNLKLEGSILAKGDETAAIGRFIKELKDNPRFGTLFVDIQLSNLTQEKIKEFDVYDFVLLCVFKRENV